jgi:hypothetical protein
LLPRSKKKKKGGSSLIKDNDLKLKEDRKEEVSDIPWTEMPRWD